MLVSCSVPSSTLKMEATCSSETPISYHQATVCYIPEGRSVQFNWKTKAQVQDDWRKILEQAKTHEGF
jgi:hypothetical protein